MILDRIIFSVFYRLKKVNKVNIKGQNNIFERSRLFGCIVEINGNNNLISISKNSLIRNTRIYINGNNCKIILGDNVQIKGGELWLEDENTELNIGSKTTIESAHLAVTENNSKIIVGENCMFAQNIEIRTGDSHVIEDKRGIRINEAKDVIICDNVWLASRVLVLKGVLIENGNVVGAGSIVSKSLTTKNCINVGIPARVIKEEIIWKRERK